MTLSTFLCEPPHPENENNACKAYTANARMLQSALSNIQASCCTAARLEDKWILGLVMPEQPACVVFFQSADMQNWQRLSTVYRDPDDQPIESVHLFSYKSRLCLVYCSIEGVCRFSVQQDGQVFTLTGELAGRHNHASVFLEGLDFWLLYGSCMARRLRDDLTGFIGNPIRIKFDLDPVKGAIWQGARQVISYEKAHSPLIFKIDGLYHLMMTDTHRRCYRENVDVFMAVSDQLTGPYSRRYLVLPNSKSASLFMDSDHEPSALFIGSTEYSVVHGKPAIARLEKSPSGFFRPDHQFIYEGSSVDFLKPAGDMKLRDTFIFAAPDGQYYMTGTSRTVDGSFWFESDGIWIWQSPDLVHWSCLGKVYDYKQQPDFWQNHTDPRRNTWAPEISFFYGTYWITYSQSAGFALLKSLSGEIEGPYCDMGRFLSNRIDSGFFIDEDGSVFVIFQNGMIAPLSDDGSKFTADPLLLLPVDGQQVGYEGAGLIKVRGKYVLYAAEWNGDGRVDGTYDMMYAWSDHLFGPYTQRRILVPHGGHGSLFFDRQSELHYTMFGNDRTAPFRTAVGIGSVQVSLFDNSLTLTV